MLSRDKVGGCCNLVGTAFNGGQRIGITVPVVDELRWQLRTSSQFFLRNYRWQVRFGCRRRGGAKLRRYTSGFYAFHRGLRDGVGMVAKVIFQMRPLLLGMAGPNRPSILQMYNIGTAEESRYDYNEYMRKVPYGRILTTSRGPT